MSDKIDERNSELNHINLAIELITKTVDKGDKLDSLGRAVSAGFAQSFALIAIGQSLHRIANVLEDEANNE